MVGGVFSGGFVDLVGDGEAFVLVGPGGEGGVGHVESAPESGLDEGAVGGFGDVLDKFDDELVGGVGVFVFCFGQSIDVEFPFEVGVEIVGHGEAPDLVGSEIDGESGGVGEEVPDADRVVGVFAVDFEFAQVLADGVVEFECAVVDELEEGHGGLGFEGGADEVDGVGFRRELVWRRWRSRMRLSKGCLRG